MSFTLRSNSGGKYIEQFSKIKEKSSKVFANVHLSDCIKLHLAR